MDLVAQQRTAGVDRPLRRIKKIPPELRRRKPNFSLEPSWYKRLVWRLKEDSQFLRSTIQFTFILLCLWIGYEFHLFVKWGMSHGSEPFVTRPPGVEGFLPISALMSLSYWIQTGIVNNIHPASIFIFLAIVGVSILLKKAFCSWLCPIGTLSEALWLFGQRVFGKNVRVPRWLDYPLRSLKYLLLLYFVYSIVTMDVFSLRRFIYSPYNKVADIKMYLFFADISTFALWTILMLMFGSVIIKNFWCRYLCPYGALLGFLSFLSPFKITRNKSTCIDCELCTKACPSSINVHRAGRVWSDECMSCLQCVEACPVKNTLVMSASRRTARPVPSWVFGALVAGLFVGITGLAMLSGYWQNGITRQEYQRRFQELDKPVYQHFRGNVPEYTPHD
ncbi:MAG: (Fe-S)-binding protein [Bacteroidia bacterium]|nr:MAG: (Fe-S)-binding protein [Bacteroidia bacterium]